MNRTAFGILSQTLSNAKQGLKECASREGISQTQLFASYMWNCFVRDWTAMMYSEIAGSITRRNTQIAKETRDKLVIALPGFIVSTHAMDGLITVLEEQGKAVERIDTRILPWNNLKRKAVERRRKVQRILRSHPDKQVCIFGYSQGGQHAHLIAAKENVPSVSFGTPVHAESTPAGYVLAYYGQNQQTREMTLPDNSVQLAESFSIANPLASDGVEQIEGLHTHFPINRREVALLINDRIDDVLSQHYEGTTV